MLLLCIHHNQHCQRVNWGSPYLVAGEEPSSWLPPRGTGRVWIRVVVWHVHFLVAADVLFAQGQGFKRSAMFHLPLTQSWTTWHGDAATRTDYRKGWKRTFCKRYCKKKKRMLGVEACSLLVSKQRSTNAPGWCLFQLVKVRGMLETLVSQRYSLLSSASIRPIQ